MKRRGGGGKQLNGKSEVLAENDNFSFPVGVGGGGGGLVNR